MNYLIIFDLFTIGHLGVLLSAMWGHQLVPVQCVPAHFYQQHCTENNHIATIRKTNIHSSYIQMNTSKQCLENTKCRLELFSY